jgi:hypothetical protein
VNPVGCTAFWQVPTKRKMVFAAELQGEPSVQVLNSDHVRVAECVVLVVAGVRISMVRGGDFGFGFGS